MSHCVFCEIVAGRSPAYQVMQDEHAVAFLDTRPAAPGHTLVVPRRHVRDIWQIDEQAHAAVATMACRVAALLKAALGVDALNLVNSSGAAAGQDVFHFHLHVVPRSAGDGLHLAWNADAASADGLEHTWRRIAAGS